MNHIGLFEGIGGFSEAAEAVGWETIAWCEWNNFCKQILKNHYPNANEHDDITKTDFTIYRGQCDILTGGFPCQPFSVAGKQLGTADDRHLWPEMLRAIREIKPRWVIGENVPGIISWSDGLVFEQVLSDLEAEGYEVWPCVLPAASVNAPHKRDRVWVIAYCNDARLQEKRPEQQAAGVIEYRNMGAEFSNASFEPTPDTESHGNRGGLFELAGKDGFKRKPEEYGKSHSESWDSLPGRATPDTTSQGQQERQRHNRRQNDKEIRTGMDTEFERLGKMPITPDTGCKGLEWREFNRTFTERHRAFEPYKSTTEFCQDSYWQNFPTQSPVRIGDDGFCTDSLRHRIREDSMGALSEKEIDKIISEATSQWVKETIKAGGNAIVPQVAIQIFKAIDFFEIL